MTRADLVSIFALAFAVNHCAASTTRGTARRADSHAAAPRVDARAAAATTAPPVMRESRDVNLAWGSPVLPVPSCFYFSGPGVLGRDDPLGDHAHWTREGITASLAFSESVVFTGTIAGTRVSLSRHSDHSYSGPWRADEMLEGTYEGGTLRLHYRYKECQLSGGASCPGSCTIDADVVGSEGAAAIAGVAPNASDAGVVMQTIPPEVIEQIRRQLQQSQQPP